MSANTTAPQLVADTSPRRRSYTAEYKGQIIDECDAATAEPGKVGQILRREGLYSSHLSEWRKLRKEHGTAGLTPGRIGRPPRDPELRTSEQEVERLRKENAALQEKLYRAEIIMEAQKKLSAVLATLGERMCSSDRGTAGRRVEDDLVVKTTLSRRQPCLHPAEGDVSRDTDLSTVRRQAVFVDRARAWRYVQDMRLDYELIDRALLALAPAGVDGRLDGAGFRHAEVDFDALVAMSRGSGPSVPFAAEIKRVVRPSHVAAIADRFRELHGDVRGLVIAEHVSTEAAELLRGRGIAFIDTAGNAFLDAPEFFVWVTGRRPEGPPAAKTADPVRPSGWQVAFALLRDPAAASLPVRSLGELAGVSHGAAATALAAFDARGWVRRVSRSEHHVVSPGKLLDGWLAGYADRLGPRNAMTSAVSPGSQSAMAWARSLPDRVEPDEVLLGGEVAAELAGLDIRGTTGTVHVRGWGRERLGELRLIPAATGPITVYSAFAPRMSDPADPQLVDPLVVLAELSVMPDDRLDAARSELRARVLARATAT